jgi:peroxiredoxin
MEDYRGKRSVVLVFTRGYPGYICPLCTSYTAQIAHRYADIAAAGAEVLLVFPGSPEKVGDFVKAAREVLELEGPGALPFPVLLDVEMKNVELFGIRGELARPSTYVIDRTGTVRFAFVGEQPHERPDVDTILRELRRAGGAE